MAKIDLDFFEKVVFQNILKKDTAFLASVVEYVDKSLFRNKDIGEIVDIIKTFYLERDTIPSLTEIKAHLVTAKLKQHFISAVESIRGLDSTYNEVELVKNTEYFLKQRKYHLLVEKAVEMQSETKEIDSEEIQKELEKIHTISLVDNLGLDYFAETARVVEYLLQKDKFISTGYMGMDNAIGGGMMAEGRALYCVGGETNVGKAQPVSLILRTPNGSQRFGDLKVGDSVYGKNGLPTKITHIHPQGIKQIYKVQFMDGRETLCCPEHLWTVWNSPKMRYDTLSTETIKHKIENYTTYKNRLQVPLCEPVNFETNNTHFIHPYIMGCLLGDGGLSIRNSYKFTNFDEECLAKFKLLLPLNLQLSGSKKTSISRIDKTFTKNTFNNEIKRLKLSGTKSETKFIPEEYIYSSIENRFHILSGFIDTDGFITKTSSVEILLKNEHMIDQLAYIVYSLGGNSKKSFTFKKYKNEKRKYYKLRIRFPFSLKNKLLLISRKKERLIKFGKNKKEKIHNTIVSVTPHSVEEAMCITVDAKDSLYLTNDFIVTHNSIVLANVAVNVLFQDKNVIIHTLEMSEMRYAKRISSILTNLAIATLPDNINNYEEYINDFKSKYQSRLIIKEFPTKSVSAKHLFAFTKTLERRKGFKPHLQIFDYPALMVPSVKQPSKHTELQFITQEVRGMTYLFDAPGMVVAQLNRGSHKAQKPGLDNVSGSWDSLGDYDGFVTLAQTDADREANILRYCGDKSRDGSKGIGGALRIDYDTLRLYDDENENQNDNDSIPEQNVVDTLGLADLYS